MSILDPLLALVGNGIHHTIATLHYAGVALLMAIESANVPLPSELIMPYAGWMVQQGKLNFHGVAFAGAVGCVLGSVPSYWLGRWGGRSFLERYGRWLLLSTHDLDSAVSWTNRYGDWAFLLCRMLPVVRTFISLPAGILEARFWPFVINTFIGSLIWSYGLTWAGVYFGENLSAFKALWHRFDLAILFVLAVLGGLYVWRHLRRRA